jgi:hypothetical protein
MDIETNQTVPEKALCCGSHYLGGHALPGNKMRFGLRVFYKCGASLSVHRSAGDGAWLLLSKNCCRNEETEDGEIS